MITKVHNLVARYQDLQYTEFCAEKLFNGISINVRNHYYYFIIDNDLTIELFLDKYIRNDHYYFMILKYKHSFNTDSYTEILYLNASNKYSDVPTTKLLFSKKTFIDNTIPCEMIARYANLFDSMNFIYKNYAVNFGDIHCYVEKQSDKQKLNNIFTTYRDNSDHYGCLSFTGIESECIYIKIHDDIWLEENNYTKVLFINAVELKCVDEIIESALENFSNLIMLVVFWSKRTKRVIEFYCTKKCSHEKHDIAKQIVDRICRNEHVIYLIKDLLREDKLLKNANFMFS
jgi:hypothetical protein